jgi:hypothetical protein
MLQSYISSFSDKFLAFAGDDLGQEILELLVKMSPTDEETTKFQEYQGDPSLLGPADRFILGILQVPNAFERLDAMLYRASFGEELQHVQSTIATLEVILLTPGW